MSCGAFGYTNRYRGISIKFPICPCDRRSVWKASIKEVDDDGKLSGQTFETLLRTL